MTCHNCKTNMVKAGKGRNDLQRYKCQQWGKRFTAPEPFDPHGDASSHAIDKRL
jgi:hypothetical protein